MTTRLSSNAFINHHFKKGFLLKEEDLAKLVDFVRTRGAEVGALDKVILKVYRADNLVYETCKLENLYAEENVPRNLITRLQILLKSDQLDVKIEFDSKDGVSIVIESADKDRAYLLFSEIKEYLHSEVVVQRKSLNRESEKLLTLLIPLAVMCMLMTQLGTLRAINVQTLDSALKSGDANVKLDLVLRHLFEQQNTISIMKYMPLIMLSFFVDSVGSWLLNYWYPRNVFYFGKKKNAYDHRIDLRSKIYWGIVIATIVGLLSSFLYSFLAHKVP